MIQTWKVARELRRIRVQCHGLLATPYEALRRRFHCGLMRRFGDLADIQDGRVRDVAIFAIYQPGRLSESTFSTLRHLVEQGFATIVVSNAPLTSADRRRLSQNAIAVYQRPNFGYDMGAFQDVLKVLPSIARALNSLILVNDSIWFPIRANSRLIEQMKANPASAVAAQMFHAPAQRTADNAAPKPILASYLMMFKKDALSSNAFQTFWRDYRMSSNKEITIRRGERGLSSALYRGGVSMAGVYTDATFESVLLQCSPSEVAGALEDMILFKRKDRETRQALLAEMWRDSSWENNARAFIRHMAARKNVTCVLPTFCVNRLGVEFVKKNNEMHYRLSRQFLSRAWQGAVDDALLRPFLQELDAATTQDVLPSGLYEKCCAHNAACDSPQILGEERSLTSSNGLLSEPS